MRLSKKEEGRERGESSELKNSLGERERGEEGGSCVCVSALAEERGNQFNLPFECDL